MTIEEAADKHIQRVVDAAGHPGWDWETRDVKDAFIAGAEWQKEQMMKAVFESWFMTGDLDNPVFKKQKCIILKEDDKG